MPDLNLLVERIKACEDGVSTAEQQHTLAEQALDRARGALADTVRDFDEAVRQVKQTIMPDRAEQLARAIVDEADVMEPGEQTAWQPVAPGPAAGFDVITPDDEREEGITRS